MKVFKYLSIVLVGIFLFIACQKELSVESGFAGKIATGSLVHDSLGNCSNIVATGSFIVDSTLTDSSYVTVQVNFATGGSYRIFTDTQNGFSFQDSGFKAAGLQTIKLKAAGKPILAKQTTFQVAFDTSFCSFTVNVIGNTPAVYTLVSTGSECVNATVDGTYTVGTPLNSTNKVTLEVNVTVAGGYFITTGSVGGMTFSGTGNLNTLGLQIITLQGSGTPTAAGKNIIPVSTSTSSCSFTVPVTAGTPGGNTDPNASDTAWSFTQGTNSFHGRFFDVFDTTVNNTYSIVFGGITAVRDTIINFGTAFPGTTIQPGTYNTQNFAAFSFTDYRDTAKPAKIFIATPNEQAVSTKITISSYDTATRIITGTFAGTAMNATNSPVPITNGRFKARVR